MASGRTSKKLKLALRMNSFDEQATYVHHNILEYIITAKIKCATILHQMEC